MIAAAQLPAMDRRVKSAKGETIQFSPHAGQYRAWNSEARFILVLAGSQSGKTSFAPWWLRREIQLKGPGDYLAVSPSFPLLSVKFFPELRRILGVELGLFKFPKSPKPDAPAELTRRGELLLWGKHQDIPTYLRFGHADNPDSLESMTVKAAVCDEAGQKRFRLQSWQAIRRRLSIHQGRALLPTTPYDLGWLFQNFWQPWEGARKRGERHPEIEIINFRSIDNPVFPRAEYDATKLTMPEWAHLMFYDGLFQRPAGLIYDCWDAEYNVIDPFPIPPEWPRELGLDFGGVNTAAIFFAKELTPLGEGRWGNPTGRYFGYREYHAGGKTIKKHVADLLAGDERNKEPRIPSARGGSSSEGQWRRDFADAGLPIAPPEVSDVEVGILRMYAGVQTRRLIVFNTLKEFLGEISSYQRVLNDKMEPTDAIQDKETYHLLDAGRYWSTGAFKDSASSFRPSSGTQTNVWRHG